MKKVLSTLLLSAAILFVSTNAQAQTKAPLSDSAKAAKKAARAEKKAEKAKAAAATTTTPAVTPAPAPTPAPATKTTTTPKTVTQGVNKSADKAVGTDAKGRTIYEGPKGGRYVLTAAGNKEYIKKPS